MEKNKKEEELLFEMEIRNLLFQIQEEKEEKEELRNRQHLKHCCRLPAKTKVGRMRERSRQIEREL
jgi:hypothetical protein